MSCEGRGASRIATTGPGPGALCYPGTPTIPFCSMTLTDRNLPHSTGVPGQKHPLASHLPLWPHLCQLLLGRVRTAWSPRWPSPAPCPLAGGICSLQQLPDKWFYLMAAVGVGGDISSHGQPCSPSPPTLVGPGTGPPLPHPSLCPARPAKCGTLFSDLVFSFLWSSSAPFSPSSHLHLCLDPRVQS